MNDEEMKCMSFDGTEVPYQLEMMECGGTPLFDVGSAYAYRCDTCNAVIGSVGQSKRCQELNNLNNA